MKIILVNEKNLPTVKQKCEPNVMALGFFDGVHKGHQKVITTAKEKAKKQGLPLAVMSFFPHPKTVFSNEEIDYLMPMEQKAERLKKLGVDIFYIIEFTKTFASLSPQQFVQHYLLKLGVKFVVAGFDYTYGSKGAGTIHTIERDSQGSISVNMVEKYSMYGEKISSTCIRNMLRAGQVETIAALLGKPYEVRYSFANGLLPYYTLPETGSYFVTILIGNRAISHCIYITEQKDITALHNFSGGECTIIFHERVTQHYQEIS